MQRAQTGSEEFTRESGRLWLAARSRPVDGLAVTEEEKCDRKLATPFN